MRVLLKLMHMQFDSHNHATISIFVLYCICTIVYHLIHSLNPIAVFFICLFVFTRNHFNPIVPADSLLRCSLCCSLCCIVMLQPLLALPLCRHYILVQFCFLVHHSAIWFVGHFLAFPEPCQISRENLLLLMTAFLGRQIFSQNEADEVTVSVHPSILQTIPHSRFPSK